MSERNAKPFQTGGLSQETYSYHNRSATLRSMTLQQLVIGLIQQYND